MAKKPPSKDPEPFPLEGPTIELQHLLKAVGAVGTGGEAKHEIQGGGVHVNDQVELRRSRRLSPGDVVSFRGRSWRIVGGNENPLRSPP